MGTDPEVYSLWTQFELDYSDILKTTEEVWYDNLNLVKTFLDQKKKRPSKSSKDTNEKRIGEWLVKQTIKFNNNKMNNAEIHKDFHEFTILYGNIL